jgi:enterochelin esterase-like enzyme
MRNLLLFLSLAAPLSIRAEDPMPAVPTGRVERMDAFPSRFVAPRNIDVWLPPGYDGSVRCAVIYMHDGQMLFDGRHTWTKTSWRMAETTADLIGKGRIPSTIVVGIWNNGLERHSEYFPEKALPFLPKGIREEFTAKALTGKPRADDYLRFIVQELKPAIDAKYATLPDRQHTIIMGSSMGGIISLYAICEYPEIFGGAGCLSTHWLGTFEKNAAIPLATFDYLQGHLPDPKTHRIYFDHGTITLDALYGEAQAFADVMLRNRGYTERNFMSLVFPGEGHTEDAWAKRVATPIAFLEGP